MNFSYLTHFLNNSKQLLFMPLYHGSFSFTCYTPVLCSFFYRFKNHGRDPPFLQEIIYP